jgi:hypothetical protein
MGIIESIGNLLNRKTLGDEETINRAAVRCARGDEPKTEKEAQTLADTLARLGKGPDYLSEKIGIVRQHDAAIAAEKKFDGTVAEAKRLREKYSDIEAEIAPHVERLKKVGDELIPAEQHVASHARHVVGKAAQIRGKFPELFEAK